MKKGFFLLVLMLLSSSFIFPKSKNLVIAQRSEHADVPAKMSFYKSYDPEYINPKSIKTERLTISYDLRNFKRKNDRYKIKKAFVILEEVVNSPEFKNLILNFKWNGERKFNNNNNMSNLEIYQKFMSGAEILSPTADHKMNYDLTLYRSWNPFSGVYGYTNPDTKRIWINKKFFRKRSYTAVDVAANLCHEWVHKLGFTHTFNYNSDRPYSVPYGIGYLIEEVAKKKSLY